VVLALLAAPLAAGAAVGDVTEFPVAGSNLLLQGITLGPDGALWFAERNAHRIGRITTAGSVTEFPVSPGSAPFWIATGPDGNLWFTERDGNRIGVMSPAGALLHEFPVLTPSSLAGIAAGPDGAMWFAEQGASKIGRITMDGQVSEFALAAGRGPFGITTGPDGALWFTEQSANRVGRITTDGEISAEYLIGLGQLVPSGIAAGPDGNVWFTERGGNSIGRVTPGGQVTRFPVPTGSSNPVDIAAGPDGALWFTELGANTIGRITTDGAVTEFPLPNANSQPFGIAAAPDGGMWFTQAAGNRIGRIEAVEVTQDTTPPTAAIASPVNGAVYFAGQSVLADFACADEDGGSGLASCTGTVDVGHPVDTSLGGHVFTVTATDDAGNVATASSAYMVVAGVEGPLAPAPALNVANAGRALPVTLELGAAPDARIGRIVKHVLGKLAKHRVGHRLFTAILDSRLDATTQRIECSDPSIGLGGATPADVRVHEFTPDRVHFVWKTDPAWAGTCRALSILLDVPGWREAPVTFYVLFR
jgi:streptogramin lyase